MNRSNIYKIYQLYNFFMHNYNYVNFSFYGKDFKDELWLLNKDNEDYQIIRLSSKEIITNQNELLRFEAIKQVFQKQYNLENIKLLDIHISNDEYGIDNEDGIAIINSNYHSGIDLSKYYIGIYDVVHDVDNEEEEIKSLLDSINEQVNFKKAKQKRNGFKDLFSKKTVVFSLIVISILMFIFSTILSNKYSQSASLIFLGADYKIFTLGLKEFWRLFTYSFLHGSIIHLISNCLSLYVIGSLLEPRIGHLKFLVIYILGVIGAGLSHGILLGNSLCIGMSGGIYALFAYFILYFSRRRMINFASIMPTIMINLLINFMPGVSWQGHLGGAIIGVIFFYIYLDDKTNYAVLPVVFILLIGLFIKYYKDYNIRPFYGTTDAEVVKIHNDLINFDNARSLELRIYNIYDTYKGE